LPAGRCGRSAGRRLLTASGLRADGRVSGYDYRVQLWDTATGKELGRFEGHTGCISMVAFAPDGKTAASTSDEGTIQLLELPR
jgi:WD40 repeat protein